MTYSLGTLAAVYQYLKFDSGVQFFTAGDTIIGATSGATATIVSVIGRGEASGRVYLTDIVGTFQDNEIIYEASYGSELITNGDFATDTDWVKSANVTISDGEAIFTAAAQYEYVATNWAQADPCVVGSFYRIQHDVTNYALGQVSIYDIYTLDADGSYDGIIRATTTYMAIYGLGVTNTFHVDNVSVTQVTNAALANGTLQDTESAVTLVPDYSYKSPDIKIESKTRTRAGRLYTTKYGSYKHFSFNVNYVSSATAALVNSWWETDTELLFFVTSGGVTETHSVMLQGETPIDGFNSPSIEYYRGKIILETY